jgi:7,8-dihydroneopterin aldolase/epimerase/oxygenase
LFIKPFALGNISIEGMEFFAYHGCFEEERIIGNRFIIDISIEVETEEAELTDELSKTVNYQKVYDLVRKEMNIKSKLLEHLARRIAHAICVHFPSVKGLSVKVSKLNPPVGGKVDKVSVIINTGRYKSKD